MALVSYDYDSTSENEDEDEATVIESTVVNKDSSIGLILHNHALPVPKELAIDEDAGNILFTNLPQTKVSAKDLVEDQIEDFIPKSKPIHKNKQKVKITIPSLSDFNDMDEDEPQTKKQKLSVKGSGLISLLPPVRGSVTTTKSFVPDVVNRRNLNSSAVKGKVPVPSAASKKVETKVNALHKTPQKKQPHEYDESDDDVDLPETFDDEMWQKICGRPKSKPVVREPDVPHEETINIAPEPDKPYDGLDNQAFKELVGRNKKPVGNIKLIDINEEEILAEKDLWMAKSLTDPEMAPKSTVEDPVDPTRRKKHHITYLAQQAKANEQELQNAWAASKNNRMASRAKYGF